MPRKSVSTHHLLTADGVVHVSPCCGRSTHRGYARFTTLKMVEDLVELGEVDDATAEWAETTRAELHRISQAMLHSPDEEENEDVQVDVESAVREASSDDIELPGESQATGKALLRDSIIARLYLD